MQQGSIPLSLISLAWLDMFVYRIGMQGSCSSSRVLWLDCLFSPMKMHGCDTRIYKILP
jgi:hypothetical protein